ncbi:MAG: PilZ domain-containing protein [Halioglobus sp.]
MTGNRRHPRVPVQASFVSEPAYSAVNVSETGMCLSCQDEVVVGRKLPLTISIDGEELKLTGLVKWCRAPSSVFESGYRVGVQFENHSITQQLLVRGFVESQLS